MSAQVEMSIFSSSNEVEKMNMPASDGRAVDHQQYFKVNCRCGEVGGVYLRHWERVRCSCGRVYWALRPKAGTMKLFPWPGDPNTPRAGANNQLSDDQSLNL